MKIKELENKKCGNIRFKVKLVKIRLYIRNKIRPLFSIFLKPDPGILFFTYYDAGTTLPFWKANYLCG